QFDIIRASIANLSGDVRVQSVLIGFCFGAFLEGAAGAGSPVAICAAMLVGLGVPPIRAAVICLLANTSPVCYGGLGVPILTLSSVTDISADQISVMCGHQLPILSCLIPLYMVKVTCTWRQTFAIWPALLVGGGSFAILQYSFATMHLWVPGFVVWQLTDVAGGLCSLAILAAFLRYVWKPKLELQSEGPRLAALHPTNGQMLRAWSPFLIMALCLAGAGFVRQLEARNGNKPLEILAGVMTNTSRPVPGLHQEVERAARLQKPGEHATEAAEFKLPWLTAPGTPVFLAVLISLVVLRAGPRVFWKVLKATSWQMRIPIPTIACMLGLSYVTKYAGIDATLGVAFAETGVLYPFFAALLGWLGVFLTGSDAGSNALFGSLQKITATEVWNQHHTGAFQHHSLEQAQLLISTANSTGGVMGKMIDAQSICVATAGTNQQGTEADIFRAVIGHSILLAAIVGLMTVLQAYLPPFVAMVPR
ncbi:MAG: L-lactate permease, partial [Gemmataceae bacterium]